MQGGGATVPPGNSGARKRWRTHSLAPSDTPRRGQPLSAPAMHAIGGETEIDEPELAAQSHSRLRSFVDPECIRRALRAATGVCSLPALGLDTTVPLSCRSAMLSRSVFQSLHPCNATARQPLRQESVNRSITRARVSCSSTCTAVCTRAALQQQLDSLCQRWLLSFRFECVLTRTDESVEWNVCVQIHSSQRSAIQQSFLADACA